MLIRYLLNKKLKKKNKLKIKNNFKKLKKLFRFFITKKKKRRKGNNFLGE